MQLKKVTRYCLLIPLVSLQLGAANADCNRSIKRSDVPGFIAADYIDDYLSDARQRQQELCSSDKGIGGDKAIYITDNRYDAYLAKGDVREAARSTAALISRRYLQKQGNEYVINHGTTLQKMGWCASEHFAQQPVTSSCSAFLVADNTLVTAGHCLRDKNGRNIALDSYYVVFGYQMNNKNQAQTRFPARDVYRLSKEREVKKNSHEDWAVVELDRAVTNRRIFEFSNHEIAQGTALIIFGYPNGLPLKIADGGVVKRNETSRNVFDTNLDSYRGNSGSPVLNVEALKQGRFVVEGILVSGAEDSRQQGNCKVSVVCAATQLNNRMGNCSGERVTKINRVVAMESATSTSTNRSSNALPENVLNLFQ